MHVALVPRWLDNRHGWRLGNDVFCNSVFTCISRRRAQLISSRFLKRTRPFRVAPSSCMSRWLPPRNYSTNVLDMWPCHGLQNISFQHSFWSFYKENWPFHCIRVCLATSPGWNRVKLFAAKTDDGRRLNFANLRAIIRLCPERSPWMRRRVIGSGVI